MPSQLANPLGCCTACLGSSTVTLTGNIGWYRVANVTAMRALSTQSTNTAVLMANGGAPGLFWWDGSSVAADNGTTIIAPSDGGAGRWKKAL